MEKKEKTLFKCANDLNVKVTKYNGEVVLDEDCCTSVSIILKNSGEIATSFLGSHNPQLVRVLEKTLKGYFRSIKKTLKKEYKQDSEEEIKVVSDDLPEDSKWNGQPVPDMEVKPESQEKNESISDNKNNKKAKQSKNQKDKANPQQKKDSKRKSSNTNSKEKTAKQDLRKTPKPKTNKKN